MSSSHAWALLGVQVMLDILLVDNSPKWHAHPSQAWSYLLARFIFEQDKWILSPDGLVGSFSYVGFVQLYGLENKFV